MSDQMHQVLQLLRSQLTAAVVLEADSAYQYHDLVFYKGLELVNPWQPLLPTNIVDIPDLGLPHYYIQLSEILTRIGDDYMRFLRVSNGVRSMSHKISIHGLRLTRHSFCSFRPADLFTHNVLERQAERANGEIYVGMRCDLAFRLFLNLETGVIHERPTGSQASTKQYGSFAELLQFVLETNQQA